MEEECWGILVGAQLYKRFRLSGQERSAAGDCIVSGLLHIEALGDYFSMLSRLFTLLLMTQDCLEFLIKKTLATDYAIDSTIE